MFEDKKITTEKVKDLLYNLQNEFENELDFDYQSEYKEKLEEQDLAMLEEIIDKFCSKLENNIKDIY